MQLNFFHFSAELRPIFSVNSSMGVMPLYFEIMQFPLENYFILVNLVTGVCSAGQPLLTNLPW